MTSFSVSFRMYRKKVYGQSQETTCTFCENRAIMQTEQKLPCCKDHKSSVLGIIHCVCGNVLDLKHSKYGPFFTCEKCGVLSFSKGMELKEGINGNVGGFKLNKKFRSSASSSSSHPSEVIDNTPFLLGKLSKQSARLTSKANTSENSSHEKTSKELWKEFYGV